MEEDFQGDLQTFCDFDEDDQVRDVDSNDIQDLDIELDQLLGEFHDAKEHFSIADTNIESIEIFQTPTTLQSCSAQDSSPIVSLSHCGSSLVPDPSNIMCSITTCTHVQKPVTLDTNTAPLNTAIVDPTPQITKNKPRKTRAKDSKISNVKWRKRPFITVSLGKLEFKRTTDLPDGLNSLITLIEFFLYFFTEDLINHIVQQSNEYSTSINVNHPVNITASELKKYLGICVISTVMQCKNVRTYWNRIYRYSLIQECMPINRFEKIRQVLHFNNNILQKPRGEFGHDQLFKIRPIIETLQQRFLGIPASAAVAVGEQMCTTKARSSLKQYLSSKPHKYGYKFFVFAAENGFWHNFEIYMEETHLQQQGEKDIGESSNVVVRLCRPLTRNKEYRVYCDNYFNSAPRNIFLYKAGILSLGTIWTNRLPNITLPDMKLFQKKKQRFV